MNSLQNQEMLTGSLEQENIPNKRQKQDRHPLENAYILEKILSFVDVPTIKKARQLTKLWNAEGAKILLTKCYVRIPWDLGFEESSPSTICELNDYKNFLSLKSPEIMMIPNIIIEAVGDIEKWKSFGVLGSQVKSLKLTIDCSAELLQNLLDLLPNLNYLSLKEMNHQIIKVLTSVMSKPEKDGNSLIISKMILQPENGNIGEKLGEMEMFSNCANIMFEELEFDWCLLGFREDIQGQVLNIMNRLLTNSQNTLKKLTLHVFELYLSLLEFPCMTALTNVELYYEGRQSARYFPHCKFSPSFRFSDKFPNLHGIIVEIGRLGQGQGHNFFVNLFENGGTAHSVKHFEFRDFFKYSIIDHVFKVFPNIEDFQLTETFCSRKLFDALWTLGKNLKKLDITIDLNQFIGDALDLDSLFTGFESGTVGRLKNHPNSVSCTLEELEALRVNPSILDLKELKELRIRFEGQRCLSKRMLTVAGEYAFRLLPSDTRIILDLHTCKSTPGCFMLAFYEVSLLPNVVIQ